MTAASRVRSAGDLGMFRGGSGFPIRYQGNKSGDLPFFKVSDMNKSGNELFMRRANNYVSESTRKNMGAVRIPAGAIIFAKVGAAVFLERKRILAHDSCIDNNMAAFIVDEKQLDIRFGHYLLTAFRMSDLVAVGALPSLNGGQLRSIPLLVPTTIDVQKRINAALTSADDFLVTLEDLIAKKQDIQQGLLQQLLSGRTRLPGFTAEWTDCHLGDVLAVRHGRSQKSVESPSGTIPILATGGRIGWADRPLYSKPSVLIGRKGTIDRPQYQSSPFWTVDTLFYTEISIKADARFLFYVFQTVDWRSLNEASGVPSLSSSRVENVKISLPDLAEQKAIRVVLDDSGTEIAALAARLAKARAIKTGMMQQLLTGRTQFCGESTS